MSSNNETAESAQLHIFQTQKDPIKRNNMSIVDMNRSKIKFLTKALSRSQMTTYPSVSTTTSTVNNYNNTSNMTTYHNTVHVNANGNINQQQNNSYYYQQSSSNPVQNYNLQFRMKEKFQDLYKKILKISRNMGTDQIRGRFQKRFIIGSNQQISSNSNNNNKMDNRRAQSLQQQLIKLGYRPKQKPSKSMLSSSMPQPFSMQPTPLISSCSSTSANLQINTSNPQKYEQPSIRILGHTRYKPRLISISKPNKMSNNIKDYLSVQKIRLKDLQDSIVQKHNTNIQKSKGNKAAVSMYNQLTGQMIAASDAIIKANNALLPSIGQIQTKVGNAISTKYQSMAVRSSKKFVPPFETYYYRDFIWRVAYSNQKILQFPLQYQSKLKVYIGKGNNSRLVRSIITRRNWYQVTDKIEEACFVWTQIKVQSVFNSQLQDTKNRTKGKIVDKSLYLQQSEQKQKIYNEGSIWTEREEKAFRKYFITHKNAQSKMSQNMKHRNKAMPRIWQKTKKLANCSIKQSQNTTLQANSSVCSMPLIHPQSTNISVTLPLSISNSTSNLLLLKPKLHNHLPNSYVIGNKKALFQTMSDYYEKKGDDVFNYLPMTFHICQGLQDAKYFKFLNYYYAIAKSGANVSQNNINNNNVNSETNNQQQQQKQQNVRTSDTSTVVVNSNNSKFNAWIVKPGQNTNRGQGITVCLTLDSIKSILKRKDKHNDGSNKTYIVQKYIEKPLLYRRRKFDLRHYIMINCSNGFIKGYFFKQGYVRTTSSQYTLKQGAGSVHLTNDAVQKNLADYGKYEKGNKISYDELDHYIGKGSFYDKVYPQMKKIATDVICASAPYLDPQKMTNFEIYGMDFMIDDELKVWLIQVNTNPCLELSCPLLAKIIPKMIQQTLKIVLDPYYSPPCNSFSSKSATFTGNTIEQMQYQLVYDDRFEFSAGDAKLQNNKILNDQSLRKDQDDCYEDDGEDWNQDA